MGADHVRARVAGHVRADLFESAELRVAGVGDDHVHSAGGNAGRASSSTKKWASVKHSIGAVNYVEGRSASRHAPSDGIPSRAAEEGPLVHDGKSTAPGLRHQHTLQLRGSWRPSAGAAANRAAAAARYFPADEIRGFRDSPRGQTR